MAGGPRNGRPSKIPIPIPIPMADLPIPKEQNKGSFGKVTKDQKKTSQELQCSLVSMKVSVHGCIIWKPLGKKGVPWDSGEVEVTASVEEDSSEQHTLMATFPNKYLEIHPELYSIYLAIAEDTKEWTTLVKHFSSLCSCQPRTIIPLPLGSSGIRSDWTIRKLKKMTF